ncbi:MAG: cupredoxin domain-containing protein [Nitrososphaerales archaeon]
MKSKYIYYAIAAMMVAVVAYPVAYSSITNYEQASNPFFCAPLIPCQKQPPGAVICIAACTITLQNSLFSPGTVNATQGSTIQWVNKDGYSHTVTAFNSTAFSSGLIPPGHTYTLKIPATLKPGAYYYFCSVHPFMIGLVNVLLPSSTH